MKKSGICAIMAAGLLASGLSAGSAKAADLGGDCCADLEERVAELEATTVRKGNRKVSLTISGWVAEQVVWWDDGQESNVYVTGIGRTLQSHFKMSGSAQITPGFSAGYVIHVEVGTVDDFTWNAQSDESADLTGVNDTGQGLYVLQSYWFLKSETLGKLSVGKMSQASDNAAILVDGSGSLVPANWLNITGDGLNQVNPLGFCHTIGDGIGGDCNGVTLNVVRYDTPVFGGFSFSASWGEDDMWDVAGRYAGEFNGIKLAAAVAYSRMTDENTAVPLSDKKDVGYFQAGLYVEHTPTGLFAYGAYGREDGSIDYGGTVGNFKPDGEHWYVKAGLRRKWAPLGHTVLYGEYGEMDDMYSPGLAEVGTTASNLTKWGVGIVQEIDAAAMSLWLSYRRYEGDWSGTLGRNDFSVSMDDVDTVKFGALINF